ncbi:RusA family crossover junction endodeoxyribonuclease [Eggerthellaceae bacterium zg-893]|nr:RusA family crossover junction endodeoxyribonuclease [Eggerthellaceae bacterium zg-893]
MDRRGLPQEVDAPGGPLREGPEGRPAPHQARRPLHPGSAAGDDRHRVHGVSLRQQPVERAQPLPHHVPPQPVPGDLPQGGADRPRRRRLRGRMAQKRRLVHGIPLPHVAGGGGGVRGRGGMNPYLEQSRRPALDYLGLEEIETVCTRIRCDRPDLPRVVGAMRPRMDTRGGRPHMHTAGVHQKAMDAIAGRYEAARGTIRAGFKGPVAVSLVSHRRVPKSWPARRRGEQDTMKPDADNVLKLVADALSGVAYADDRQIVAAQAFKAPRAGDFDWLEIEVTYCEATGAKR